MTSSDEKFVLTIESAEELEVLAEALACYVDAHPELMNLTFSMMFALAKGLSV